MSCKWVIVINTRGNLATGVISFFRFNNFQHLCPSPPRPSPWQHNLVMLSYSEVPRISEHACRSHIRVSLYFLVYIVVGSYRGQNICHMRHHEASSYTSHFANGFGRNTIHSHGLHLCWQPRWTVVTTDIHHLGAGARDDAILTVMKNFSSS